MEEALTEKSVFTTVDDVILFLGPFGRFQQLLTFVFCIMIVPSTYQVLITYFITLNPPWKCSTNSTICLSNDTFPNDNKDRCTMPRNDWEYTEHSGYSIITQFDIYCEKMWMVHLTTSIIFVGWMFGAVVLGWVADNYGRKIVIFPSLLILIIVGFSSAFSPNIYVLITCRFIMGFFVPGTGVQEVILLSEFVSTKFRPLAITFVWCFFTAGLCLLGLKAYFIREWKLLIMVCSAPYIFVILFYKFIPESVRWLHLQSEIVKLMDVFHRIGYWNKKAIPADFRLLPIESYGTKHKTNPLDLFRTCKKTLHSVIQGYGWLVNGMVYYGLSLAADDLGGNLYTNYVLLSAIEFPANFLAAYLCERIGRKLTVSGNMAIGSIACIVVAFIPTTGKIKVARVVLGVLGKCCITISFGAIYTWSIELYPTNLRAEGMGFLQITSRIGAASSPWIAKGLAPVHPAAPFIVMGVLSFIAAIVVLWLPETKGKPAPDISNDETTTKSAEHMGQMETSSIICE